LCDQYEPENALGIPEISVSQARILSYVRDPDADIGNEVRQQAGAKGVHTKGDQAADLIDRLGGRDLGLSPNQEEEITDGLNNLYQRPEEETGSEDEHQNRLVGIWKKPLSRGMN
jgi:hypothetical protein